jgi:hypothetical protein
MKLYITILLRTQEHYQRQDSKMNWSENLQKMIDVFINIDS